MRDSMVNKKEPVLVAQTLLWWGCNFAKPQLHHTVYQIVWRFSIQSNTDTFWSVQKSLTLRKAQLSGLGVRCIPQYN